MLSSNQLRVYFADEARPNLLNAAKVGSWHIPEMLTAAPEDRLWFDSRHWAYL